MTKQHPSGLHGWTELCSDVNWEDYHGMWARKVAGAWWILVWTNLEDAMGEAEANEYGARFECAVKRLDLDSVPADELAAALQSYGLRMPNPGEPWAELATVEACVSYGLGAPMHEEHGNARPRNVRARARRVAESLWRDERACAATLARPVNAIGSTAEEYGRGDVMAALWEERVPGPAGELMRKLWDRSRV